MDFNISLILELGAGNYMAGILHKTLKNIRNIITMGKLIGFELVIAVHKRARALLMCFKLQNYKIKHKVNK